MILKKVACFALTCSITLTLFPAQASSQDLQRANEDWQCSLTKAIAASDYSRAERALSAGADSNAKDSLGLTPLEYTVLYNNEAFAKWLVARGADIEHRYADRKTLLERAVCGGNAKQVEMLLNAGASAKTRDSEGKALLCIAAEGGNVGIMKRLKKSGAIQKDALCSAALCGSVAGVQALLKYYRFAKVVLSDGLHSAVCSGHTDLVQLFLDCGAEVRWMSLVQALESEQEEVVWLFIDCGKTSRQTVLHCATGVAGSEKIIHLLLESGVQPNKEVFYSAIRKRSEYLVRLFLEFGVQPSEDALEKAVESGHKDSICLLLDNGAKATSKSLSLAAMFGYKDIMQLLIGAGADVNKREDWCGSGQSSLYYALGQDHKACVKMLLENGARIDCPSIKKCLSKARQIAFFVQAKKVFPAQAEAVQEFLDEQAERQVKEIDSDGKKVMYSYFPDDLGELLSEFTGTPITLRQVEAKVDECQERLRELRGPRKAKRRRLN